MINIFPSLNDISEFDSLKKGLHFVQPFFMTPPGDVLRHIAIAASEIVDVTMVGTYFEGG